MNRKHYTTLMLAAALFAMIASAPASEIYFVQPNTVKFYAAPSFAAKVLGSAESGYRFIATGREGNWLKLDFSGRTAYLPVVQASTRAPLGKVTARSGDASKKLSGRARSSATAAVAGVKGLTYEDRARVSKGERMDYDALEKVEAIIASPEELKDFMSGGKP
jgi:hypothetical protein